MLISKGVFLPGPVSMADRTGTVNSYYSGTSALPMLSGYTAYGALYKYQLWVGTVVRKLAYGTARIPFDIKRAGAGTDQEPENGPLTELMARPNPLMSGFQLWLWTVSTREVYGEAFWRKVRDRDGRVRMLEPMHPANVLVRADGRGGVEYVYTAGTRPVFPSADVVAFTNYNPENALRGLSVLEGLRMTLINEDSARRATASMWQKGARPGVIMSTDNTLSDGAIKRLKAQFEGANAGADNTGRTVIFEEGVKAQVVQLSAEEMQYIESRKLNREEVCAAYDVPPAAVHILDKATFSNITENLRSVYRDTMAPKFVDFESVVNSQLVPDFYPAQGEVFTRFNMDEVLRGDFENRMIAAVSARTGGLFTGNEIRPMFGLPRSENPLMDEIFANAALTPLGSNPAAAPATSTEGESIPEPVRSVARHAVTAPTTTADAARRSVMGRFSRIKSRVKAVDRPELIEVHEKELRKYFDGLRAAVVERAGGKAFSGAPFSREVWDTNLRNVLMALARVTAETVGGATAAAMGGQFDMDTVEDWLYTNATIGAQLINDNVAQDLAKRLAAAQAGESVEDLFNNAFDAKPGELALSRVAVVANFASIDTARKSGGKTKTWVVNSANPRPSHASMSGETVPIDDVFSNGMDRPGDWAGGADEVSGCQCTLDYGTD